MMADEVVKRPRTPRKNPTPKKRECSYNVYTPSTSPSEVPVVDSEAENESEFNSLVALSSQDETTNVEPSSDVSSLRRSPRKCPKKQDDAFISPKPSEKKSEASEKHKKSKERGKEKKKSKNSKLKANIAKIQAQIAKMKEKLGVGGEVVSESVASDSSTDVTPSSRSMTPADKKLQNTATDLSLDLSRPKSTLPFSSTVMPVTIKALGLSDDVTPKQKPVPKSKVFSVSDMFSGVSTRHLSTGVTDYETAGSKDTAKLAKPRKSPRKQPVPSTSSSRPTKGARKEPVDVTVLPVGDDNVTSNENSLKGQIEESKITEAKRQKGKCEGSQVERTIVGNEVNISPLDAGDQRQGDTNISSAELSGRKVSVKSSKSKSTGRKKGKNIIGIEEKTKVMEIETGKGNSSNELKDKSEPQTSGSTQGKSSHSKGTELSVNFKVSEKSQEPTEKSWKSPRGKTPKTLPTSHCTSRILRKSVEKVKRRMVFSPENKKSVRRILGHSDNAQAKESVSKSGPVSEGRGSYVHSDMEPISEKEEDMRKEIGEVNCEISHDDSTLDGDVRASHRLAIKRKLKLDADDNKVSKEPKSKARKKSEKKEGTQEKKTKTKKPKNKEVVSDAIDITSEPKGKSRAKSKSSKKRSNKQTAKKEKVLESSSPELIPCPEDNPSGDISPKDFSSTNAQDGTNDEVSKPKVESNLDTTPEMMSEIEGYNLHLSEEEMESPGSQEIHSLAKVLLSLNQDSQHLEDKFEGSNDSIMIQTPPTTPKKRTPRKTPLKLNFKFRTPSKAPAKSQWSPSKVETTSRSPARFVGHFSSKVKESGLSFGESNEARQPSPTKIERLTCSRIEVLDTQASGSEGNKSRLSPQPGPSGEQTTPDATTTPPPRRPIRRSLNLGVSPKPRKSPRKRLLQKSTIRKGYNTSPKRGRGTSPRRGRERLDTATDSETSRSEVMDSPQSPSLQIVEDDNDSDWEDEEADERLEAASKAQPIKLTATNVRTIIKEVISHPGVINMVTNKLMECGFQGDYELRNTRSRTNKGLTMPDGVWPLSNTSFTEINFSDDDEDEDYDPLNDYDQLNELSDADSESVLSSRTSDLGSPPSHTTPTPSRSSPVIPGPLTIALSDNTPKTPTEEPPLPFRLRSKFSLEDTPLEEIEANFVAPDITADLYDTVCDDQDWMAFLNTLTKTSEPEMNDTYDEKNDPEYNIMEDNDDDDNYEDYRTDKAVKVTQKELEALHGEFFDFVLPGIHDDDSQDDYMPNVISGSKDKSAATNKSIYKPPITLDTPGSILMLSNMSKLQDISTADKPSAAGEPAKKELKNTADFTCDDQYIQLQDQMRKHVQLLAQSYVLATHSPKYDEIKKQAVTILSELQQFGLTNMICYQKPSFFHAANLAGALALTQNTLPKPPSDVLQTHVYKSLHTRGWKRKPNNISLTWPQMEVFSSSKVFIFPQMLPELRFHDKTNPPSYQIFTEAEDALLALGLEQFSGVGSRTKDFELIKTYLLPVRSVKQITNRVRRLRYDKGDNLVKEYYKNKKLPQLNKYLNLEPPDQILAPYDRDHQHMPTWFESFAYVKQKYTAGGIGSGYDLKTGRLTSLTPEAMCSNPPSDSAVDDNITDNVTATPPPHDCQSRRRMTRKEARKAAPEAAAGKALNEETPASSQPVTTYMVPVPPVSTPGVLPSSPVVVISSHELQEYGAQLINSPEPGVQKTKGTTGDPSPSLTSTPHRVETRLLTSLHQKQLGKMPSDIDSQLGVQPLPSSDMSPKQTHVGPSSVTNEPLMMSPIQSRPTHHPSRLPGEPLMSSPIHTRAVSVFGQSADTVTVVSPIGKNPVMSPAQVSAMTPIHPVKSSDLNTPVVHLVESPAQGVVVSVTTLMNSPNVLKPSTHTLESTVTSGVTSAVSSVSQLPITLTHNVTTSENITTMTQHTTSTKNPATSATSEHISKTTCQNLLTSVETVNVTSPFSSISSEKISVSQNPVCNIGEKVNVTDISYKSQAQNNSSAVAQSQVSSPHCSNPQVLISSVASSLSNDHPYIRPFGEIEQNTDSQSSIPSPFKTPHKPKSTQQRSGTQHLSPANILLTGGVKSSTKPTVNKRPGPDIEEGCTIMESCQLHLEPDNTTGFNESSEKSPDESDISGYIMETPRKFIPNEECSRSPTVYSNSSFSNSPGYSDCTPTKSNVDTPTKSAVALMAAFAECMTTPVKRPACSDNDKTLTPSKNTLRTPEKTNSPFKFRLNVTPTRFRTIVPKAGPVTPPRVLSPLPKKVHKSPRRKILQQKAKAILPKGFVVSTYAVSPTKKAAASLTRRARTRSGYRKIKAKPPNAPGTDQNSTGGTTAGTNPDDTDDVLATADENEDTDVDVLETDLASGYDTLESEYASEDNQSAEEKENNEKAVPVKAPAVVPPKPKAKRQRRWKKKPKKKTDYNDSASDNEDGFGMGARFGHDSQDDEDDPFAQFMAASTTIRFDPKRSTSRVDSQNKSKSKLKREMTLHMLAPDLIESDVMRDERDTAFAQAFLARVRTVMAEDVENLEKFLQLLYDFGKSGKSPVQLHKEVGELLGETYTNLLEEFSGFLLPEQARETGCFVTNGEYTRARIFLRKLEVFFEKHPSHLQKIYKVLAAWSKKDQPDSKELRDQVIPLLRGQQHLVEEFTRLINTEKPLQQTHADDYEEVTIPEDDDSRELPAPEPDVEDIVLGESAEDALYGTSRCKCRCHAVNDKFFSRRRKHCDSCSMQIIRGKLYMQTMEKTLRLVQVKFVGNQPQSRRPVEEEGGQKEDGISSDEETYRETNIEAEGEQEAGPPAKKRRRVKNTALKVKLPGKKSTEQTPSEVIRPQVTDNIPVIEVAQDSILVPDTSNRKQDGVPVPTDFSQLRQEITNNKNPQTSVRSEIIPEVPTISLATVNNTMARMGSYDRNLARNLIVETSMMGTETPMKLRPMMRIASKDIRMSQMPSDSDNSSSNSNSNSHSEHSNSRGSGGHSNDASVNASSSSSTTEVNEETRVSVTLSKSPPHVDLDEAANMGIESTTTSGLRSGKDGERILLKLNVTQNETSREHQRGPVSNVVEETSLGFKLSEGLVEETSSVCENQKEPSSATEVVSGKKTQDKTVDKDMKKPSDT